MGFYISSFPFKDGGSKDEVEPKDSKAMEEEELKSLPKVDSYELAMQAPEQEESDNDLQERVFIWEPDDGTILICIFYVSIDMLCGFLPLFPL